MRRVAATLVLLLLAASAQAADDIRTLVEGAVLAELRWPDVSDYRKHLDAFYRTRNDVPAWTRNGRATQQAIAITRLFAAADDKGVRASDYDGDRWAARIAALTAGASAEELARFDVAVTATLMRYISDLHIGRVNPRRVDFLIDVNPKKYDLPKVVGALVDESDIAGRLETIEPRYDGYRRLRNMLVRYRALSAEGEPNPLPQARIVEPGSAWPGIPALAAFLRRVGDLDTSFASGTYDGALVDAVKRFQERHGLEADGRIGPGTFRALRVPLSRRVEQIELSLERWRWAPTEIEGTPIVVNIPEFRLSAYGSDMKVELAMNVVVGKSFPSRQTPVFADTLKFLIFRPYWYAPRSIARNEIRPKMAADPTYARRLGYEIVNGNIRQKPGPNNAMGNVKFMFPNSMNIYLHDTPGRHVFSETRRDFSHGCVRVGNPAALAEWVLRDDPKWTLEEVEQAMHSGKENRRVNVRRAIPILIVYATAIVRADGKIRFYDDIYGHDATLENALAGGYPYPE